jgi:hypothetical protein
MAPCGARDHCAKAGCSTAVPSGRALRLRRPFHSGRVSLLVRRRGDARPSAVCVPRRCTCVVVEGLRAWGLGRSDRPSGSPPRCSLPFRPCALPCPFSGRPHPPTRREDGRSEHGQPQVLTAKSAGAWLVAGGVLRQLERRSQDRRTCSCGPPGSRLYLAKGRPSPLGQYVTPPAPSLASTIYAQHGGSLELRQR